MRRHSPNHVVGDMYIEINNLSQALNMGLLVLVVASTDMLGLSVKSYFSFPLFALCNFLISIIFYTRYYFDTEILERSYTPLSILWYFAYIVAQGVSISFLHSPVFWFVSTGIFLLFGAGFYVINIQEICRKERVRARVFPRTYFRWQQKRMVELFVLALLSFGGAYIVSHFPTQALFAGMITLAGSIWQMGINNDYRKQKFLETGV